MTELTSLITDLILTMIDFRKSRTTSRDSKLDKLRSKLRWKLDKST